MPVISVSHTPVGGYSRQTMAQWTLLPDERVVEFRPSQDRLLEILGSLRWVARGLDITNSDIFKAQFRVAFLRFWKNDYP